MPPTDPKLVSDGAVEAANDTVNRIIQDLTDRLATVTRERDAYARDNDELRMHIEEIRHACADLERERDEARAEVGRLMGAVDEKDEAYRQRNVLVRALAGLFPSGIRRTNIEGWEEEWQGCCYIDLPTGQVSYHYHDSEDYLFNELPPYTQEYDGHDKETAEQRILDAALDAAGGEE